MSERTAHIHRAANGRKLREFALKPIVILTSALALLVAPLSILFSQASFFHIRSDVHVLKPLAIVASAGRKGGWIPVEPEPLDDSDDKAGVEPRPKAKTRAKKRAKKKAKAKAQTKADVEAEEVEADRSGVNEQKSRRKGKVADEQPSAAVDIPTRLPATTITKRWLGQVAPRSRWHEDVLVEMARKFGKASTQRVSAAFRRLAKCLEMNTIHSQHPLMRQRATFFIEGLRAKPMWPMEEFPWVAALKEEWGTIREIFEEYHADHFYDYGNGQALGLNNAYGEDWHAVPIVLDELWKKKELFPALSRLLERLKVPAMEVLFARLPAGATIKPHTDECNFVLTAHLGLVVPEGCVLNVGDQQATWKEGQVLVFDSSFLHSAANASLSNKTRTILLLRVWHPDLTVVETQALAYLFERMKERPEPYTVPMGKDMYLFRIEGKDWKLPRPALNAGILQVQHVLYDKDEDCYLAPNKANEVVVENGHTYEIQRLITEEWHRLPEEFDEEQRLAETWGYLFRPGDVIVDECAERWDTDPEDSSFYVTDTEGPPREDLWPDEDTTCSSDTDGHYMY
eukprot:GGOE01003750.1.p1 GENE.GGOE01003750.1~~GGOE01003750.1.p1  ORF type:complete len:635 (+),score=137.13 GGOE01003750.1:198-1907(+)